MSSPLFLHLTLIGPIPEGKNYPDVHWAYFVMASELVEPEASVAIIYPLIADSPLPNPPRVFLPRTSAADALAEAERQILGLKQNAGLKRLG